jgi:hypothetical protein
LSHPNSANNLFASSCDNLRPIIAFDTLLLGFSVKLVAIGESAKGQTLGIFYLRHFGVVID